MAATLTGSVGYDEAKSGDNKTHDVCLVQAMLRAIKDSKGQSYYKYSYDGGVTKGKSTHKGIIRFQKDKKLLEASNKKDKSGLVAKDGPTFKKLVESLPAVKKGMRSLPDHKLVYLEGKDAEKNSSVAAVTASTQFTSDFRTKVSKLVKDMYSTYGIVLWVVAKSGNFRTFDFQSGLYEIGRTKQTDKKKVTGAGPGESNHNFGNGADIGFKDFQWLRKNGTVVKDADWLNSLEKTNKTAALSLWKLRNKLTVLHASAKQNDLVHLQTFSDGKVSMIKSLIALLNKKGKMKWAYNKEYRCDFGLGGSVYNIGSGTSNAQAIWKQTCDVSGSNLAAALTDAQKRRKAAKGTLPANQEAIFQALIGLFPKKDGKGKAIDPPAPVKSTDLKKEHYAKTRELLRKDFELSEAGYKDWVAVNKS